MDPEKMCYNNSEREKNMIQTIQSSMSVVVWEDGRLPSWMPLWI